MLDAVQDNPADGAGLRRAQYCKRIKAQRHYHDDYVTACECGRNGAR